MYGGGGGGVYICYDDQYLLRIMYIHILRIQLLYTEQYKDSNVFVSLDDDLQQYNKSATNTKRTTLVVLRSTSHNLCPRRNARKEPFIRKSRRISAVSSLGGLFFCFHVAGGFSENLSHVYNSSTVSFKNMYCCCITMQYYQNIYTYHGFN